MSRLASMLEQVDEDLRGATLLEPDQTGSGTGAGGQPFGDCAAGVPAVIEDLCGPLSQHAPLAAPARIDAVLKPASGAGTADINAKAFATDPGSEEDPPDLPTVAAILPPTHGPVPAGRASRAVREESDPVAPATSHAHRQPDTFDIRFLRWTLVRCCGLRGGPRDAVKAPPRAAPGPHLGDEPFFAAVGAAFQGAAGTGLAERHVVCPSPYWAVPQASAASLNGSLVAAKTERPVYCSRRNLPNSAAPDALFDDIRMAAAARAAPGPAVVVTPDDTAVLPAGSAGLDSSWCPAVAVLAETAVLALMGKNPPLASAVSTTDSGDVRQFGRKSMPEPLNKWRRRFVLIKRTAGSQPFCDVAPGFPAKQDIRDDRPRHFGAGSDVKDRVLDKGCVPLVSAGVTAQGTCMHTVESGRTHRFPRISAPGPGPGPGTVGVTGPAGTTGCRRYSSGVHHAGPSAVGARRNAIKDPGLVQRDSKSVRDFPGHGDLRPFRASRPLQPVDEACEAPLGQPCLLDGGGDGVHRCAGKVPVDSVGHLGPGLSGRHRNSPARMTFALRMRSRAERSG